MTDAERPKLTTDAWRCARAGERLWKYMKIEARIGNSLFLRKVVRRRGWV